MAHYLRLHDLSVNQRAGDLKDFRSKAFNTVMLKDPREVDSVHGDCLAVLEKRTGHTPSHVLMQTDRVNTHGHTQTHITSSFCTDGLNKSITAAGVLSEIYPFYHTAPSFMSGTCLSEEILHPRV